MTASLPVTLSTDERMALRRLADEHGVSLEEAAAIVVREYLIGAGYLEMPPELDEDTATAGEA